MNNYSSISNQKYRPNFKLSRNRRRVLGLSLTLVLVSILGLALSSLNPSIHKPLKLGLDFTGGTQIRLERKCDNKCGQINSSTISMSLTTLSKSKSLSFPNFDNVKVQLLDNSKSISVRLPFLSAQQGQMVIDNLSTLLGPLKEGSQEVNTIGPSLGGQLLKSSLLSLLVAFTGISVYISFRYDRKFAFIALVALAHDVIIVCGIFAWLGLLVSVEVNSLFAVALLTIAGYSVNDTVVVFDRIRKRSNENLSENIIDQVDNAVASTLTRTIYTSGSTLLPLVALIIFGGATLYWFAVALAIGVLVGSWSSIVLAPSLICLWDKSQPDTLTDPQDIT